MRHILALTVPAGGLPPLAPWMTAQISRREAMARVSDSLVISHATTTTASHLHMAAAQVTAATAASAPSSSSLPAGTTVERGNADGEAPRAQTEPSCARPDDAATSLLPPARQQHAEQNEKLQQQRRRFWEQMRRYRADYDDVSSLSSNGSRGNSQNPNAIGPNNKNEGDDDSSISSSDEDDDDDASTISYGLR
jgi:hypothetical protein